MIWTIKHFGKGKTIEILKISVDGGVKVEGSKKRQSTEEIQVSETNFCDAIMMSIYICQNPQGVYNTKVTRMQTMHLG